MTFFTNLYLWTKCLWLITISKRIDLKRSAWRHFVDNKLYFHFLLNFSQFPFVKYVFHAFKDRTKSLYLITISKRIDLKRSALRHFVDNELYFQFPLNFSQFPFVRYVFYAFKDRTKSTEYLQLTDYGDAHFKLLPFLNELSNNFLLGLDLKNF